MTESGSRAQHFAEMKMRSFARDARKPLILGIVWQIFHPEFGAQKPAAELCFELILGCPRRTGMSTSRQFRFC